ncbi:MAG: molybdenum cofactor guanylyltransferase, partial [Tannerellaceae bacterium]
MESMSGYVLAGGKSSRFGSNKALALLAGKPMIEYSLDLLRQYSQYIYISG